jgi:hypothetical protein
MGVDEQSELTDNHQLLLDMLDPSSPCTMSDLERMTRPDLSLTCHRILPRRVVVLSHGQGMGVDEQSELFSGEGPRSSKFRKSARWKRVAG